MSNLGIKVHFHKPGLSSVYQPLCPWTIMTLWSQRQGDAVLLCGLSWSAKGALDGKAIVHCCVVSVHLGYVRWPRGRAETQNEIVWLLPQYSPLRSTLLTLEQCYTFYVGKKGGSICLYFLWSTFSLLGKAVSVESLKAKLYLWPWLSIPISELPTNATEQGSHDSLCHLFHPSKLDH